MRVSQMRQVVHSTFSQDGPLSNSVRPFLQTPFSPLQIVSFWHSESLRLCIILLTRVFFTVLERNLTFVRLAFERSAIHQVSLVIVEFTLGNDLINVTLLLVGKRESFFRLLNLNIFPFCLTFSRLVSVER
jgi:hypothetical protein